MAESIVITTPETTGDAPADHNQKMIDKANGVVTPADEITPTGDRPAWLPEKFKSPEDMAKAYAALEGKLGGQSNDPPADAPADPTAEPAIPDDKTVTDALAKDGLSLDEFSAEFNKSGALSEESYAKLLAAGYDKGLVDNYISGQQARASLYEAELKGVAGGTDSYDKMVTWAKATMTAAEIDAYNASVSSSSPDAAKLAISGLKARYEAVNGREPSFVKGTPASATTDAFASRHEITAAMKDPRYAKDPAYRQQVISKLNRSNF